MVSAVLGAVATPAHAQQRTSPPRDSAAAVDSASRDSITARLARAEAAIELLRKQLAVEATTVVRTRSRLQVELSARILTSAFLTDGRVNNVDVPQFVLQSPPRSAPPSGGSPGTRALGLTLRQSRVGAALSVDSVFGANFESDFELDFSGGVSVGPGDRRLFPEPRLRTARAQLLWHRTTLMIGSDTPLISDLNPISLAAVGTPEFVAAGNLWNWIPQVRVSHDVVTLSNSMRVALQGAVLSPFSGAQAVAETDAVDAGERSGRPFVQGRVHVRWGRNSERSGAASDAAIGESGGEIGIGVHRGWLRVAGDSLTTSRALSMDARVMLLPRVELRGEAYRGQLLRGLGGGAIGQSFGRTPEGARIGRPLRDAAGWVQLNVQATTTLVAGAGCGRDDVNADDAPTRFRNDVCSAQLLWRPSQPIVMGFTFRRFRTQYVERSNRASQLNLSFGFEL